jgi:hypothetical protein
VVCVLQAEVRVLDFLLEMSYVPLEYVELWLGRCLGDVVQKCGYRKYPRRCKVAKRFRETGIPVGGSAIGRRMVSALDVLIFMSRLEYDM